jgi:hypothetical protein
MLPQYQPLKSEIYAVKDSNGEAKEVTTVVRIIFKPKD